MHPSTQRTAPSAPAEVLTFLAPFRRAAFVVALLVLTLSSLLPNRLAAQEGEPGVFGEVIDVRVVNVEVVVTDRDGLRVPGLGSEDFSLTVDGAEVPISYFSEIRGSQAVTPTGGPEVLPGVPSLAVGEPVGTSYLLFIDDYFSTARDRDQVLEAMIEDLPLLGPQDRMAVVAYDGHQLTMLSTWSQDPRQLEKALKEATRRDSFGLQRLSELRTFRSGTNPALRIDRLSGRLDIDEEQYALRLADQVKDAVAAATATLRSFAQPPGRRVMLLLSGGWPYMPAEYAVADATRPVLDGYVPGGPALFELLTDTANRLGYTVYPVDVPGLLSQLVDAESSVADNPGIGGAGLNPTFLREQEVHASLNVIADATGGRALLNAARLDSLPLTAEDTRSYYWLGFTPSWQGDDAVHDIRVEVRRPDLKVRSRESYQDLSRRQEVSMMVESALLFGNAPSARPLLLRLGAEKRAGRHQVEVPLTILVPATEVTVLPIDGSYVARLELRIAALDGQGGRSEIPVVPLELTSAEQPGANAVLRYDTTVKLRRAQQDLVVAVYDSVGGNLLSAKAEFRPRR